MMEQTRINTTLPPSSFKAIADLTYAISGLILVAEKTSMIQSLAGTLEKGQVSRVRPYQSPHHTASQAAIIGGGRGAGPPARSCLSASSSPSATTSPATCPSRTASSTSITCVASGGGEQGRSGILPLARVALTLVWGLAAFAIGFGYTAVGREAVEVVGLGQSRATDLEDGDAERLSARA